MLGRESGGPGLEEPPLPTPGGCSPGFCWESPQVLSEGPDTAGYTVFVYSSYSKLEMHYHIQGSPAPFSSPLGCPHSLPGKRAGRTLLPLPSEPGKHGRHAPPAPSTQLC